MAQKISADNVFNKLAQVWARGRGGSEVVALKKFEGQLKRRVFNQGQASDGSKLGQYSPGYAKFRKKRGRQVLYKDLEFHGDLRRSIKVGKLGNKNVLQFTTDAAALIGGYQEKQTGKEIWGPSDDEIEDMVDAFLKNLFKYADKNWK